MDPVDPVAGAQDAPHFGTNALGPYRLCEVAPFVGPALEACRTTVACGGCGSGYCRSELEALPLDVCPEGLHPSRLRFVGGATAGAGAIFHVACELARS